MTSERISDYLDHIERAATDACDFVDGMSQKDFLEDKRTQQAVIMSLIVIGEASTKAMDKCQDSVSQHSEIPWRNMRGMRNRIAHGYFDIDLDIVWETVQSSLPDLIDKIHAAQLKLGTDS
jgi:uncharacterized protein with HEPN domain